MDKLTVKKIEPISTRRVEGITIKSPQEIILMREAGRVVAMAKACLMKAIQPGITTRELDIIAEDSIRNNGGVPSFKGYTGGMSINPFPGTICASVNEQIVHGIPGDTVLNSGDVLSVDVGAIVNGFHGDSAFTIGVGKIPSESQRLINTTRESLLLGIQQAKAGGRIGDISNAVATLAEYNGYSVVREYVGHGIGRNLHEDPQVPNYGKPGRGPKLKVGMVIAIEPMLNIGDWKTKQLEDGWTVVTADGSLSAHFEETVAITEKGPEVLTAVENI